MEMERDDTLKTWQTPELTEYGAVEEVTRQIKLKELGSSDDFGINGVQDPSGL